MPNIKIKMFSSKRYDYAVWKGSCVKCFACMHTKQITLKTLDDSSQNIVQ